MMGRFGTILSVLLIAVGVGLAASAAGEGNTRPRISMVETRGGAAFASHDQVGEQWLPLRGARLLRWLMWDVYSAALYISPDTNGAPEMLASDTPRRLVLHYHRNVKAADIVKATEKGLAKNPAVDVEKIRTDLDRLYACYEDVGDGDRYTITYRDNVTVIELNGVEKCRFEGDEFARAFFGIWISDHPLDRGLAEGLRGES